MKLRMIPRRCRLPRLVVGFALLASPANTQETKTVTGAATYRERIALPPDSVFEATLEDVSSADAPAEVIGSARLEKPGQPPFRFSIQYDPARVLEGRSYSVRARVTAGGNLMFTTDQSYPVLTKGHGSQVAMMIMRRAGGSSTGKREMRGMFRYMADAATFTDCQSRERWPVATEGEYKAVEAAYLRTRRQPGDELLVSLEGQIVMRANPDSGQPAPTLIVERYIGVWPGETCGAPLATAQLQETYWKLTRIDDKPVIVAEKQREPSLVFRSQQSRVTGFGGCNNLTGAYKLSGDQLIIGPIAATRMACLQGMDTEGALFKALESVRGWKILGQHLELYDAAGSLVARFEARALK